jgi:DNA-binding FrmR family transcriptional regulator
MQMQTGAEIENLGKRTGTIEISITNRIKEIKERISGIESMIEMMHQSKEVLNLKSI